ncbi:hypothetical protein M0802_015567 [Mischocyttarus mexicanus]|nr:hypothetical protein M0802_015567 [Mischocyttarus mexicanus]
MVFLDQIQSNVLYILIQLLNTSLRVMKH